MKNFLCRYDLILNLSTQSFVCLTGVWVFSIFGHLFHRSLVLIRLRISLITKGFSRPRILTVVKGGVCKMWTGYLRMADADGKMRIVKGGWKNADKLKKKRIKRENVDRKKGKKQANTKRKKRNRERKENDAPLLLLRTAVKNYTCICLS